MQACNPIPASPPARACSGNAPSLDAATASRVSVLPQTYDVDCAVLEPVASSRPQRKSEVAMLVAPADLGNGVLAFTRTADSRRAHESRGMPRGRHEAGALGVSGASVAGEELIETGGIKSGTDQDWGRRAFSQLAGPRKTLDTADFELGPQALSEPPRRGAGAGMEWKGSMSEMRARWRSNVAAPALPGGLKALAPKGHPWMRCSTFALVPANGRRMFSIRDAAGNTCAPCRLLLALFSDVPRLDRGLCICSRTLHMMAFLQRCQGTTVPQTCGAGMQVWSERVAHIAAAAGPTGPGGGTRPGC
jgi:hypothetical protein